MFRDFAHRQIACTVDGTADKVILSREMKGKWIIDKEYMYNGVFAKTSAVSNGSLVATSDKFLILSMRLMAEGDKYCSMIKTNADAEIKRYASTYDANGNQTGITFSKVEDVSCHAQFINAQAKQDEVGLLPSTSIVLYMQTSANIKSPQGLESPDRVIINGKNYQVDVVDSIKYPNLYHVQLSEDFR